MASFRRMPGGVLPPHLQPPSDAPRARRHPNRPLTPGGPLPAGSPFDPAERPLGMIAQTWQPTDEPVILSAEPKQAFVAQEERVGPSLTVWIILITFIVVVILAVISYRNAPP
jgi:hypothetical protein